MLAPWKKSYNKPGQHIKKQRHDFAGEGAVKAMFFLVVVYGYETWTTKNG